MPQQEELLPIVIRVMDALGGLKTDVAVVRSLVEGMKTAHDQHVTSDEVIHSSQDKRIDSLETTREVNKASTSLNYKWLTLLSTIGGAVGGFAASFLPHFGK